MKNRVTELLKIKYPILMGGMAWAGTPALAAAVSQAGGLGIIGSGAMRPDELEIAIRTVKNLTDKPFGVNIMLASPYADQLVEVVISEKVPVVTFGAGNPAKYIPNLKKSGAAVIPVVASDSFAKLVERAGADAVVAEGMESGGHIGEVSTVVLTNRVSKSVTVPVIAAGGIADGRGMAAAFALGAEGIQMGTRFLATIEAEIHESYKKKILTASIRDTVVTGAKLGHPARVLKTPFAKKVCELEVNNSLEAEQVLVGSLREAVLNGNLERGSFMAGQCAGLIDEILSVKDVIEKIMREFVETVKKLYEEVKK
ncbi:MULTISPECIES: nitronate monooxygenase [Pseudothermotoga]|jgi:enoyl-[acyl-carrier protein] reductase II|uniref:2-nitropropane dioxygenase NPD n=1 Tax=Pseudothermotoga lettingae (strain ATCC BAA-301 / DSM 14385 / NBRC 107922 / TMO) TaxID=416591 RepID=A8F4B2_PSELT|nr:MULTISPECIES: nitronate monooxygenase [Pseudothermotoga]ABV32996.1 2-nitropropane dioxygenase NPD [Pseudothermotoga lettingae TMO]KUK21031.1 MAG: 2-nitropropane dioxygenase NPD [Pseudothermotoga lettingae]MDI3494224.1 enoyl-[acyl-carrier protein] reductase [Pseudothermotoga sp.]MDK2884002.1 enoyl-[acyl-carrier protein] reductase [Pseudothermotoga sp.]GLI48002.1 2-nitropropane dioxygenase [Pseudothermotoga lettingae TMO]